MRWLAGMMALVILMGCSTIERADRKPKPVRANIAYDGEVPDMLRGTVKQHVAFMGYAEQFTENYQPIIASGYGLVVDLDGTGSRDVPPQVRATMIADLARRGIGEMSRGWGGLKPEDLIDSPNTAIVIVEGIIPQAASGRRTAPPGVRTNHPALRGTLFDVHVRTEPSSGTTSLEGGLLIPTMLRFGTPVTGRLQSREIAIAEGPIFINPFAEPGAVSRDSVVRTVGRILDGGEALRDMPLRLVLLEPSHTRAAIIQTAINRRFPQEPGQGGPTARAMNDTMVDIRVPPSQQEDVDRFVDLISHATLRQQNPEAVALTIKRILLEDPSPRNADAAAWRWLAIGDRSLAVIRQLYDYPEDLPRVAALRAGAGNGDPMVIPHLMTAAGSDPSLAGRLEAIDLLALMPHDPRIETGLRPLLSDDDPEIRLRAADALIDRRDPLVGRWNIDDKFELVAVDSTFPMIYVTQRGIPRIVLFGDLEIERPLTLQAWSNRLLVRDSKADPDVLEVFYRPDDGEAVLKDVSPDLAEFTDFLAHNTTPEEPRPGLGLSYGRTVGALHQLWQQQYVAADFKAEQDRLLAAIQRLTEGGAPLSRPEFDTPPDEPVQTRFLEPTTLE